jgi:hypothetical protein
MMRGFVRCPLRVLSIAQEVGPTGIPRVSCGCSWARGSMPNCASARPSLAGVRGADWDTADPPRTGLVRRAAVPEWSSRRRDVRGRRSQLPRQRCTGRARPRHPCHAMPCYATGGHVHHAVCLSSRTGRVLAGSTTRRVLASSAPLRYLAAGEGNRVGVWRAEVQRRLLHRKTFLPLPQTSRTHSFRSEAALPFGCISASSLRR